MSLLSVENVSKRFGGLMAVRELSFTVPMGEVVGLIGPNGAGKTTLFNLVAGHLVPTSGEVKFKGQSVLKLPPHRRVHLGMVRSFQSTVLYSDATALENVMRACWACRNVALRDCIPGLRGFARIDGEIRSRALELLDFVDLRAARDTLARNLAYGHQRALGIAIGLATNPELLMLDEPVAGMNPGETAAMAVLIARVNEAGTTVLLVEHDMSFVMRLCRKIVVIANGAKIAEGTPEEIRAHPEVISAYLGGVDDAAA